MAALGTKITRDFIVLANKSKTTLSQNDYDHLQGILPKLVRGMEHFKQAADDWLFAHDDRALQLSLDDMVINVMLASETLRHLAQSYNWQKYRWILGELGISEKIISFIDRKRLKYIAEHHDDPFALTRKWFKKVTAGCRSFVTCIKCGFVNEVLGMKLVENQLPDDSTRSNPEDWKK